MQAFLSRRLRGRVRGPLMLLGLYIYIRVMGEKPTASTVNPRVGRGEGWVQTARGYSAVSLENNACRGLGLGSLSFLDLFCLRGRFPSVSWDFSTLSHNDPAAHQDHCERSRIRTRDLCHRSLVHYHISYELPHLLGSLSAHPKNWLSC